ncbi:hypothetical protein BP00DRAFT_454161 [Aspergillus indologenus CBS 114.80]|uniref:Invertebrate defensins family profile domain-containing protein n=1 Tax=Aspergillus indologenus CBS 114.80 TaxID=1450541 RepID=A0A2V5IGG7_9EURO|nr:hypothetical protein BP00DRAFT_454161 [Aspergillus indologenus CBS 114.80]
MDLSHSNQIPHRSWPSHSLPMMKFLAISTLCSLVLASAVPLTTKSTVLEVALAAAQKSCQTPGGIQIANLACRNTCIAQGGGWTGGFCDDQG